MCLDRIGMENDSQGNPELERDIELRRIHVRSMIGKFSIEFFSFFKDSMHSGRRSNQPLIVSNYSYDPRLHLQPLAGLSVNRKKTNNTLHTF